MYKYLRNGYKSIIFTTLFILTTSSFAYADVHQFQYVPNDQATTGVTLSNVGVGTDSNSQSFWYRTTSGFYTQNLSAPWTTSSYIYVFIEGNTNYLYNQSYIYGTSTYTNLSFFNSNGHDPEIVRSFTVDGRTISIYRYYTNPALSLSNNLFQMNINGATGSNGQRIYGIIPSNSYTAPSPTDQTSMYTYLSNFVDTSTHIVSFTPNEGDVLASSTPVNFSLNVYVNPADVGTIAGVRITFHNIDQNTLLSSFSKDDIVFYDAVDYASGTFTFSSSTMLTAGNYRIEASLDRSLAWGLLRNPFSSINDTQSHQFVVGASTFIGSISQTTFTNMNNIYNSMSATTTSALATSCNVLNGFDTSRCLAFLFVPDGGQLNDTLNNFKAGFLSRAPWGYFTRMYTIWQTSSTTSLPTITISVPMGNATDYQNVSANFGDMLVGGVAQLNSITGPREGKSIRDVTEPMVQLLTAIAVLFTILTDLMGTHRHGQAGKHST
jgi:hypothetical protein